jgi:hypothetical protein
MKFCIVLIYHGQCFRNVKLIENVHFKGIGAEFYPIPTLRCYADYKDNEPIKRKA